MANTTGPAGGADPSKQVQLFPAQQNIASVPLDRLFEAGRPLLQDYLNSQEKDHSAEREHVRSLAELAARERDQAAKRFYPLVYGIAAVTGAIALFACFRDRWEIATHLGAALIGAAGGWGLRSERDRQAKADSAEE